MLRKVRFFWKSPPASPIAWRFGLFGFYDRGSRHSEGLAIHGRGLLLWCLALTAAAYLVGATALFYFWQRNPYSVLTYADAVFYPLRRRQIEEKKGQAFITQGTDLFRAGKYMDAATLLRLGLARYPRDIRGRIMLAQFYVLANQPPQARAVLNEGLTAEYPGRAYLEVLFGILEQGGEYGQIVELGRRYLPEVRKDGPARDERWLTGRVFAALTAAARHDEALKLAREETPGDLQREHEVLALLALGQKTEALAALDRWQALATRDHLVVLRLRVRAFREAREFEKFDAAIAEHRAAAPADPNVAAYGLVQQALAGREKETDAALQDYLFRFGGSPRNLLLIAEPFAEIGDLPRLRRTLAAAAERGYKSSRFTVLLVQLLVQNAEWAEASRLLAGMPPDTGRDAASGKIWRLWMERLIEAGGSNQEGAHLPLVEFLRSRPLPLLTYRRSVEALARPNRLEAMQAVLAVAARSYPANEWLKSESARVEQQLTAAREAAAAAAAPVVATVRLPAEKVFFQQLDAALDASNWDAAAELLRDARAAKPAPSWLAAREPALRLAQARISRGQGDRAGMLTAVRLNLNGDAERSLQVIDLGRKYWDAGDKDAARGLLREVLLRSPGFPPAARLDAEWNPKPDVKKTEPATKKTPAVKK
jgi:hypothetical protein